MIARIKQWWDGKKTHATAIVALLVTLWLFHHGGCTATDVVNALIVLILVFLRLGIQKAHDSSKSGAEQIRAMRDEILASINPQTVQASPPPSTTVPLPPTVVPQSATISVTPPSGSPGAKP